MIFIQKLLEFFKHKKWLATLGVALGLVGAALTGEMVWADALNQIVKVVIATIIGQSAIDLTATYRNGGSA